MKMQVLSKLKRLSIADDHASKRNFRLLISIATSVMAKSIAIGSALITIPVTLNYLGAENFGVWMVISSVVGFMGFTDFGIGMGLQNALSKAYGSDDIESPKHYIANAYLIVTGVACFLVLTILLLFSTLPIEGLFKIEDQALLNNAVEALKYSLIVFFLGMPIALIQRILGGIQKTYVANNVMLIGSILSLLSILTAVHFDLGLTGLSVLFVLSPISALFFYGLYFFFKNKRFRPTLSHLSKDHVVPMVSASMWTVFVQIIYTAKMNVPIMVISGSLGLLAVAEFSVAQKLTGLAASMIGIALQPLWVVYGEAYHRGDRVWVENTLKKSLKLVLLLTGLAAIAFQFLGQPLIELWLGGQVQPSQMIIACFSLWMIASTVNVCFAMLLNGTGHFKNQAVFSFICVGLALLLNAIFVSDIGVVGVIFVVFLVAELIRIPLFYFETRRVIGKLNYGTK
jgi:O-antigen/teichoic acid export membrane protein